MLNKIIKICVCELILFIFALSSIYAIDGNKYKNDSNIQTTNKYKRISIETFSIEQDLVELCVIRFVDYDEAVFRINVNKDSGYDEGYVENLFFEQLELWMKNKDHRFYNYSIRNRLNWDNRKTQQNDKPCRSYEFYVVLYK